MSEQLTYRTVVVITLPVTFTGTEAELSQWTRQELDEKAETHVFANLDKDGSVGLTPFTRIANLAATRGPAAYTLPVSEVQR